MTYRFMRGVLVKVLYPLFMIAGAFFKSKKEALQRLVIRLNNRLVLCEGIKTRRLLVLLPHCLQLDKCDIRITNNIRNCKQCGRCAIKGLIAIADSRGIDLYVATGGNLARRIVSDVRPEAIVAVACERDLSSGIADAYPTPVLGVSNARPYGPCFNTQVDLSAVEQAIAHLSGG